MLIRIAPALFVLLWSTGFIGTKLGANGAEPFTFLSIRFVLVLALLIPFAWWAGARLTPQQRMHAVIVGLLVHASYLGGVMWAMRAGMASNVAALIVSLQPVLTALLAGVLIGEVLAARHWLGLALGLIGSGLVIGPKLAMAAAHGPGGIEAPIAAVAAAVIALFGMTLGTIYQKRHAGGIDLVSGAVWQYLGALAVVLPAAMTLETMHVVWTPGVIGALAWLVIVLSIGAISLLMLLIRENAVSRTSALFYLVPGMTALLAFFFFGETLTPVQLAGLVIVTFAVVLMQPAKTN